MTHPLIPSLQACREGKSRLVGMGRVKKLCVLSVSVAKLVINRKHTLVDLSGGLAAGESGRR
jgi:hypothetical protein